MLKSLPHPANVLPPAANVFAGTVHTAAVNMSQWEHCIFLVEVGVGTTGTETFTVEACSTQAGANPTAIPFAYQECLGTNDVFGSMTKAPVGGFLSAAGSNRQEMIHVDGAALATLGYSYVRLTSVEGTASAVIASVTAFMIQGKYEQEIAPTVLV
jgi:hypothetical protein